MKEIQIVSFLPDGSVIDVSKVSSNLHPPQYLLSDSVDIDPPYGTVLNMVVASDKEPNYNNFWKRTLEAKKNGTMTVMPVFSVEEILSIKPIDMDDCIAQFRYDVFGGSARNFGGESTDATDILPVVEETLTLLFPDIKEQHHDSWTSACLQISLTLKGKERNSGPTVSATINSMMQHTDTNSSRMWASVVMKLLAAAIVDQRTANVVNELEILIGKSGLGNMFEAFGHRKLLMSTVPYLLKPLSASIPKTMPTFRNMTFSLPVVRLKTVDDIQNLPIATYGLPMTSNFPILDAIIQPDTLLQFTISPVQHKGEMGQLSKIRALLQAPMEDHRIIFIIPAKNIETFRYHPNLSDMHQFVCVDDPSVIKNISLMNDDEKKTWMTVKD